MRVLLRLLVLAFLIALAPAAQAEAPLSDGEVRGFAASLASIEQVAARHEAAGIGLDEASTGAIDSPMAAAILQMRAHSTFGEYETAMRRHGFADATHWSRVGDRVYRAYFALVMEREASNAQAELQMALSEAERNPQLSEEDKRAMRELMAGAIAGMGRLVQSSEADKAVVAAHIELLETAWRVEE